jgi:hypothetical protein
MATGSHAVQDLFETSKYCEELHQFTAGTITVTKSSRPENDRPIRAFLTAQHGNRSANEREPFDCNQHMRTHIAGGAQKPLPTQSPARNRVGNRAASELHTQLIALADSICGARMSGAAPAAVAGGAGQAHAQE